MKDTKATDLDVFQQLEVVQRHFQDHHTSAYRAVLVHMDPELEEYGRRIYDVFKGGKIHATEVELVRRMYLATLRIEAAKKISEEDLTR